MKKDRRQLEIFINDLLKKDKLPNGHTTSKNNIKNYILKEFPDTFYYIHQEAKRPYPVGEHLIRKIVQQIRDGAITFDEKLGGGFGDKVGASFEISLNEAKDDFTFEDGEGFDTEPFNITGISCLGIVSDIHIPFHDITAVKAAFTYFKESGVDGLLLNGDILDCISISRFVKNPTKKFLRDELVAGEVFFKEVRRYFGSIPIYYKIGNHEHRLDNYIYEKCPELYGVRGIDFGSMLGLKELDIMLIESHRVMTFGKLNIIHGHEYRGGSGTVNVARQMRLKAKDNVICGHWHKTNSDYSTSIKGDTVGSWAMGCLCKLKPEYLPLNEWNQGFALARLINESGVFEVENKKVIDGKVR